MTQKKISDKANEALLASQKYAKEKGIDSSVDNEVDAYRHFSWNYNTVKSGVSVKDAEKVITNHEILTQEYIGHDEIGNNYNKVTLASLMDLTNNQIGRYQASLETNKNKSDREVFDFLVNQGAVITSLEDVLIIFDIDKSWLYDGEKGLNSDTAVLIKGDIKADPFTIEIVNKNKVKFSGLGILQRKI